MPPSASGPRTFAPRRRRVRGATRTSDGVGSLHGGRPVLPPPPSPLPPLPFSPSPLPSPLSFLLSRGGFFFRVGFVEFGVGLLPYRVGVGLTASDPTTFAPRRADGVGSHHFCTASASGRGATWTSDGVGGGGRGIPFPQATSTPPTHPRCFQPDRRGSPSASGRGATRTCDRVGFVGRYFCDGGGGEVDTNARHGPHGTCRRVWRGPPSSPTPSRRRHPPP